MVAIEHWPSLPYDEWKDTYATLHMWTQIVGKIRMAQAPAVNHWWHVPLYVTSRGLTTSPMPHGSRTFAIDFDFIDHRLHIEASDGQRDGFALAPCSVAEFYGEIMGRLRTLGVYVKIWPVPVEIADPIPFAQDREHASYDREFANLFWRVLVQVDKTFATFRAGFLGKSSPVHFFWGSFDLAVTRFSGRPAPPPPTHPNIPDIVNREAYSHEVSSCGFWPGNGGFGRPAFYCYAYPAPAGFGETPIATSGAYYSGDLGEFILPYEAVRRAAVPHELLLQFLRETYAAAADLGKGDRAALER